MSASEASIQHERSKKEEACHEHVSSNVCVETPHESEVARLLWAACTGDMPSGGSSTQSPSPPCPASIPTVQEIRQLASLAVESDRSGEVGTALELYKATVEQIAALLPYCTMESNVSDGQAQIELRHASFTYTHLVGEVALRQIDGGLARASCARRQCIRHFSAADRERPEQGSA